MNLTFDAAREGGFIFPGARGWINTRDTAHMQELAQDAALITTPNSGVPAEFLAYIDPMVIEILTAVRNARKIFPEVKKGDWTTPYFKFRVQEYTGVTTPYSDYADGGVAGVNENWPSREQYIFQTTIKYGDLEGKEIYGLLNDPNLNASITPGTAAGGSDTEWTEKTADEIYADVLSLAASLRQNSQGNINEDTPLVLVLSPQSNAQLGKINTYGLSVRQMLKNEFGTRLDFVELPELYNATSGSTIMLIAKEILGIPTAQLGFGVKYRAGRVVPELSSFKQKISASTYGAVVYYPFAIATMEGV